MVTIGDTLSSIKFNSNFFKQKQHKILGPVRSLNHFKPLSGIYHWKAFTICDKIYILEFLRDGKWPIKKLTNKLPVYTPQNDPFWKKHEIFLS